MSVFYSAVLALSLIFLQLNCYVVALSTFSFEILTSSADSLYSVQKHTK